MYFGTKK
jgi:hypothetical protein